tara:strand:- start:315 stop:3227 length:2913 start_codon:yes stop_codon:yes gene_type:complete
MADDFNTPVGYETVVIEPNRTGLNYPLYMKVEEKVGDQAAVNKYGLFVPRNEIETQNVVNFINKSRAQNELAPISVDTYNANQNNFVKYAIGQFQETQEGMKSADPYAFYVNKLQSYMDTAKENNKLEDYTGFDLFRRPKDYAMAQAINIGEVISDYLPTGRGDFALGGELAGSLPAMMLENSKALPGAAKIPGTLFSKLMSSGTGVVAGASLGRGGGTLTYDFINQLIRMTAGIENPEDAEDPGMRALVEMRNSAMFTSMAAGLGPLASYLRPIIGKALGLSDNAGAMQQLADKYGIPIGISIAAEAGKGIAGSATKGFGRVVGIFPIIGTLMKERRLSSLVKSKEALSQQPGLIGDVTDYYRAQYKLLPKEEKVIFNQELKEKGFNSLDEAIEAQVRLDSFAPIQHMTDVGMFMHKSAQQRYEKFAYINNLLYESFEKTASQIKTPFIGTTNTKKVGQLLRDRMDQYKIQLQNYDNYQPQMNEMEDFIVNTLGQLPDYLDPLQIRGLQKKINQIYSNMKGEFGANFAGSDILAQARKALTTDLNNFAGWKEGLNSAQKAAAESAKKALLRANSVFAKLSPLYKSPAAQKFKLIDANMFSPGPELPGWNYSDELFNIVMKNKLTPMAVKDVKELIGQPAFDSVVRTWLDQGLKQSLRSRPIDIRIQVRDQRGRLIDKTVTDYAVDPDAFLKNIGYGEPGFEAMMDAAGKNGAVVKKNIEDLTELIKKIEQVDMGDPVNLIKRRFALGGVRSGFKTFSFGAAAGVGGAAAFGPAPVIAGLFARFTADFLSSPEVFKRYSKIIDDKASMAVKRAAYTNILRDFYKEIRTGSRLEEFPDEFKTYKGAMDNPDGFMDWLLGTGYQSSLSGVGNPGAAQSYNDKRFNEADGVTLGEIETKRIEEKDMSKVMSSTEVKNAPVQTQSQPIDMPEVPSMGDENIMAQTQPQKALSPDQRVALAGDDLDQAIALGQRV